MNLHHLFIKAMMDRSGNFAVTTAFLLPVLLGVAGIAIDFVRMSQHKFHMQNAADMAALAAASALAEKGITDDEAKTLAGDYLAGAMNASGNASAADPTNPNHPFTNKPIILIEKTPTAGNGMKYNVSIEAHTEMHLTGLSEVLGLKAQDVAAYSKVASQTATQNALSMYLVLDRSGSMGSKTETGDTKINALKKATAALTAQIKLIDKDGSYSRLAAISYNGATQEPVKFTWDTTAVLNYVNALTASGNTASTGAMQRAYDSLTDGSEESQHKTKNGLVPSKFIVFMTDGDNNNTTDDTKTKAICDKARTAKITVFTVAFMAPTRGQQLLQYCAGTSANYFNPTTMADLVAAFKTIGKNASTRATRLTN